MKCVVLVMFFCNACRERKFLRIWLWASERFGGKGGDVGYGPYGLWAPLMRNFCWSPIWWLNISPAHIRTRSVWWDSGNDMAVELTSWCWICSPKFLPFFFFLEVVYVILTRIMPLWEAQFLRTALRIYYSHMILGK